MTDVSARRIGVPERRARFTVLGALVCVVWGVGMEWQCGMKGGVASTGSATPTADSTPRERCSEERWDPGPAHDATTCTWVGIHSLQANVGNT